ncbi:MAG: hypothetical protein IT440_05070 [Phycisphaeraceae bacterium]|nr:hypothetical protein [Phycisphaeraceae bacterium]
MRWCLFLPALLMVVQPLMAADSAGEPPLWIEDGRNLKTGPASGLETWLATDQALTIRKAPEGTGFLLGDLDKGARANGVYFNVAPSHPWLVWEVTDVKTGRGYIDHTGPYLGLPGRIMLGQISQPQPGIYAVDYSRQLAGKSLSLCYMRIDAANAVVTYASIKMVKTPENYIQITSPAFEGKSCLSPGDEVTFRVTLTEPAQDVSLHFFHGYVMPSVQFNGQGYLQLMAAEGGDGKVWSANVQAQSLSRGNLEKGKQYEPGQLLIKATILGGQLKLPLWTGNPQPFNLVQWP